MKKVKLAMKSKQLAVGIALALGCSLMGVASAATTYDMEGTYANGITLSRAEYGSKIGESYQDPDIFTFDYDKVHEAYGRSAHGRGRQRTVGKILRWQVRDGRAEHEVQHEL